MSLRLILAHWKLQTLYQLRAPSFVVPVFVYPVLFYLYFAESEANSEALANRFLVSYSLYAFLGATLHQVTGSIAEDRRRDWAPYLRTLPYFQWAELAGRFLSALLSAILATLLVAAVAVGISPVTLSLRDLVTLSGAIAFGFIIFFALGTALGYLLNPRAALSIALLIFLSLAYVGGLWTSPHTLPEWAQRLSPLTPSRMWAELSWSATIDHSWSFRNWFGLLCYGAVFVVAAIYGMKRPVTPTD